MVPPLYSLTGFSFSISPSPSGIFITGTCRKSPVFGHGECQLYNEFILLNQYATAEMRAGKQFEASRKSVKVHQNVLVFYKVDLKQIERIQQQDIEKADLSKF